MHLALTTFNWIQWKKCMITEASWLKSVIKFKVNFIKGEEELKFSVALPNA